MSLPICDSVASRVDSSSKGDGGGGGGVWGGGGGGVKKNSERRSLYEFLYDFFCRKKKKHDSLFTFLFLIFYLPNLFVLQHYKEHKTDCEMEGPAGFETTTSCFEDRQSVQLS